MIVIKLKATARGQPGRAVLSVFGWKGGQTALEMTVRRNQDGHFLGDGGMWSSTPVWHALQGMTFAGDELTGEVGPWLVDSLLLDQRMTYEMQLRDGVVSDKGVPSILGTILISHAGGNAKVEDDRVTPVIHPIEEDKEGGQQGEQPIHPEPIVPRNPPSPPRPWWPWAVLACGVLAALAVGLFYWPFVKPGNDELAQCSVQALKQNSDDLVFIQNCLKTGPSGEQVLEAIAQAKEAGRCGVVQRLYAHQGQAGDVVVALAYAREFDPKTFTPGGCIKAADAETAAYWYEIAVSRDDTNPEPKQRLQELQK